MQLIFSQYLSVDWLSRCNVMVALLLCPRERLQSIAMSMYVCLSVCLRVYFQNHTRHLYQIFVHVASACRCMDQSKSQFIGMLGLSGTLSPKKFQQKQKELHGGGSVLLRQGDENPRGKGSFGGFFSIDNALYSIAIGTHTKTSEPIEMPFGIMSVLGPRNSVLCGGDDPLIGRGNFGGQCA